MLILKCAIKTLYFVTLYIQVSKLFTWSLDKLPGNNSTGKQAKSTIILLTAYTVVTFYNITIL